MYVSVSPDMGRLDVQTSCRVLQAAQDDLVALSQDVMALSLEATENPAAKLRLIDACHALSGLCRLVGADALEQAAARLLVSKVDRVAFARCLEETLGALRQLSSRLEGEPING